MAKDKEKQEPGTSLVIGGSLAMTNVSEDQAALEALLALQGAGMEQVTADDVSLPFINLIQALSPQRQKNSPKYILGAEEGDFFNSLTKELYKGNEGIIVVPVWFQKVWIEWRPRELGGGFVRKYDSKQDAMEQQSPENKVAETANHYVLAQAKDGTFREAMFSFASSKLGVSREWNAKMKQVRLKIGDKVFTPPSYAKYYVITSVPAVSKKNEPYFKPAVAEGNFINPKGDVFLAAQEFANQLAAGAVKVNLGAAEEVDFEVQEETQATDNPPF